MPVGPTSDFFFYIRRIRFSADSDLLPTIEKHGYKIEDDAYSPNTKVVEFPVHEPFYQKGKKDISIWEQLEIAAQYQHYWADNSVSITCTFKPQEAADIKSALEMYETRLKAVSFLRYQETGYEQAPYEPITKEQYEEMYAESFSDKEQFWSKVAKSQLTWSKDFTKVKNTNYDGDVSIKWFEDCLLYTSPSPRDS